MTALPATIGIDPGLSGSVAALSFGKLRVWRGFSTLKDLVLGIRCAREWCAMVDQPRMVIEQVHAMPGQGVCSMFSFGRATGAAMGAAIAYNIGSPFFEVSPQRWQNWYAVKPFDSTIVAPTVLPPEMLDQCRKKRGSLDHNACDAALIAYWAAHQTEEEMQARISEHWRLPCKPSRKPRTGTARK